MSKIDDMIQTLGLQPHPCEGGYFVETYRSPDVIAKAGLPNRYSSDRNSCTAIYYLLTPETFSELHRLPTDEIFHFYLGDPVNMLQLCPDGSAQRIVIGNDLFDGQKPQVIVSQNVWQGAFLRDGGEFALLGCTVAPGFDYADYHSGKRSELIAQYPDQKDWIERLTHSQG